MSWGKSRILHAICLPEGMEELCIGCEKSNWIVGRFVHDDGTFPRNSGACENCLKSYPHSPDCQGCITIDRHMAEREGVPA